MFNTTISTKNWKLYTSFRKFCINFLFYFSSFVLAVDTIYKSYFGITYQTRQNCILYSNLPRWAFLVYEYIIELLLVVVVGVLIASWIEKHFTKVKGFLPKNSLMAFLYASVIPVCSCSVIPMIKSLYNKTPLRVIFTFVVAAPLLNPYIIMISVTALGIEYTIIRFFSSLVLAVSSGYILEFFFHRIKADNLNFEKNCFIKNGCPLIKVDLIEDAFTILKKLIPYILVAGILSLFVELLWHNEIVKKLTFDNAILQNFFVILLGIPIYFCNGADVLFMKPFINIGGLQMGTAVAFSLTSTSICVTSFVVLIKYIGKKLTIILTVWILIASLILSQLIGLFI